MKVRNHAWAALVALIPVIAVTGASANHIGNGFTATNGGFASEGRAPGSVVVPQGPVVATPVPAANLPPVVVQPGQPIIVQQPGQPVMPSTVVQPLQQMVQAEDLEANEVRAQTIYANKIVAPEVQGSIRSTPKIELHPSVADLKTPTVNASVVYADTIKAHRVIADNIFVRDLERR